MRVVLNIFVILIYCTKSFAGITFDLTPWETTRLESGVVIRHQEGLKWKPYAYADTSGERKTPMKAGWSIITTSLDKVEEALGINLMEEVVRISRRNPNKNIVVLDWG